MLSQSRLSCQLKTVIQLTLIAMVLTLLAGPAGAPAHAQTADDDQLLSGRDIDLEISNGTSAAASHAESVEFDDDFAGWEDLPGFGGPSNDEHNLIDGWEGDSDLSYEARFAYNETTLFLGVKVTDDVHQSAIGGSNWSADGVQFAFGENASRVEYGVALGNDGSTTDIQRYSDGAAILPASSIQMHFTRSPDEQTVIYELAIPWGAARSTAPSPGSTIAFTMLVNDEDGSGRGYVEWTPGIGGTKDATKFGKLQLLTPDEHWTSWLKGAQEVTTGEQASYTLDVFNPSASDVTVSIDIPAIGLSDQQVTVPAGTLLKKTFPVTVTETMEIAATITEPATGRTRTETLRVTALKSPSELTAEFEDLRDTVLPRLQQKLADVEARGIATDYERVNVATIANHIRYGLEDIDHDELSRAGYVAATLQQLAADAEAQLDAYLAGTARSRGPVPRYQSGQITIDGRTIRGTTTKGRNQPIIFSGYGMFDQVRADIPLFGDLGTNIIDFNIAPAALFKKPGLASWLTYSQQGADFTLDTSTAQSGDGSLKISSDIADHASILFQEPNLEPNTTYHLSAWIKVTGTPEVYLFSNHNGWTTSPQLPNADDWSFHEFSFTTGANESQLQIGVFVNNPGTVWVDDYTLTEDGTTTNLMTNPGFEEGTSSEEFYVLDESFLDNTVLPALRSAEEHNIGVNLELAPQEWPAWVYEEYPDTRNPDNYGFMKMDIENPRVREILLAHIDAIMAKVKDSPALVGINLSNEFEYVSNKGSYHLAAWREHLAAIHDSVDDMNVLYGTSYASFDEVPVPDMTQVTGSALYYDYLTFKADQHTAFHKLLTDRIHDHHPTLPVHVKFMGFGVTNNDLMLRGGKDLEATAGISNLTGIDGGPQYGSGPSWFAEYTGMLDLLRSMKEQPIFNSENHMISDGETSYDPDVATWTANWVWNGALHGTSASTIWVWQRDYMTDYLAGSILNRPDAIAAVGHTSLDLNRLVHEVTAFQNAKPEVGILSSLTPRLYAPNRYYSTLTKAYTALSYSGLHVGFVTENQIADAALRRYKVLVLPEVSNLSATTLSKIRAWQRKGGTLVVIGDTADLLTGDEHDQPLPSRDRSAVLNNRRTIKIAADPTVNDMKPDFLALGKRLGLNEVVVYDAATGQPADEVEWRTVKHRGRTLLSLVNYSNVDKSVYVKVGRTRVAPTKDLIANVSGKMSTIELAGNGHALLTLPRGRH